MPTFSFDCGTSLLRRLGSPHEGKLGSANGARFRLVCGCPSIQGYFMNSQEFESGCDLCLIT